MTMNISRQWRRRGSVFCLLCCTVLLAAGCSDRRSEQLRAEGDTLRGLNRYDEARDSYERALEANPDNPMAQLGLARCSVAQGNTDEALEAYQNALALNPALEEAYVEGVQALVEDERIEEALQLSQDFSKQFPDSGGALHGMVLLKAGRTDEAINALRSLADAYPDSGQIQLELGAALIEGAKTDEAEKILKALADTDPAFAAKAQLGLVDVYQAQGRIEELLETLASLVTARPEDMELKLSYARSLLLAKQGAKAETIAREILEQDPESGWANYVVGFSKAEAGDYEEAKAFLEQASRTLPEEPDVKKLLAYAASGGETSLGEALSGQGAIASQDASMEALTWQNLWKQAALERLLANRDRYIEEGGDAAREVLTLAALFTYQADLTQKLAAGLPESSKIRGFIDAFFSQDAEKVAEHFKAWTLDEPDVLRENALAFAMVTGGSREQGLSAFFYCVNTFPENGVALLNIAQVFRRLGRPGIAAKNLQRLIAMYPENIDAHQMHYTALREGKDFEAARNAAEGSFTLFPDEKWSHLFLVQSNLDTGNPGKALEILQRSRTQFPNDPELEAILARVLVRIGDCPEATTVLEAISTTAPAIMEARSTLFAVCDAINGTWDKVKALGEGIDAESRSDSLSLLLVASLVQSGEKEAAQAALAFGDETVAGTYGKLALAALGYEVDGLTSDEKQWADTLAADTGLFSSYLTVVALQAAGLNDVAWNYYQQQLANQPPHIALAQLAFRSLSNSDSIENTGELARSIVEPLAEDHRAWIGLASVLKAIGDADGEVAAIAMALEKGPRAPEALFRHANQMESLGKMEEAVADYRTLVEVSPESGAASNNLAYTLLLVGGNDEEALKYAMIAAEKLPRDPGVLHTLGLAQMRTGNLEESGKNLKRATESDPSNPTIMYDFGRLLIKVGDEDSAKKRISYAIAMSRNAGFDFPQLAEAEALIETLP